MQNFCVISSSCCVSLFISLACHSTFSILFHLLYLSFHGYDIVASTTKCHLIFGFYLPDVFLTIIAYAKQMCLWARVHYHTTRIAFYFSHTRYAYIDLFGVLENLKPPPERRVNFKIKFFCLDHSTSPSHIGHLKLCVWITVSHFSHHLLLIVLSPLSLLVLLLLQIGRFA